MTPLKSLFFGSRAEIWRKLAREVEGQFISGGLLGNHVVQVATGDWIITLDVVERAGDDPWTRLRAPYVNPEDFHFAIYPLDFGSEFERLVGEQDIEVGDPAFDLDFVIRGNSEARVLSFFANDRVRELIHRQPGIHLSVADGAVGWLKSEFPDGVDELTCLCPGVMTDLRQLEGLFDLFAEALHQLCHDGRAYEDDVDIHIRRLLGPGGEITGPYVRWLGDPPRRQAAGALGRLRDPKAIEPLRSVLTDDDALLRAAAIDALGAMGDSSVAPSLIPFLGDAATVGGTSFQALAAASLKRLDLGALADAVLTGLSGDTSRLRDAVADHRDEVVEAFVTALAGPRAIQAVAAIVELRAVETLPTLLAVRAGARSDHALGRALDAAIRELEALGSLPRPADASDARPGTLPRAVDEGA